MEIEHIMNENDEQNLTNENFLKNEFSNKVKEYLILDEQITRINMALKERRTKLKELSNDIMKTMQQNDIGYVNIKNGMLVHNSKEVYKGLNKKNLQNGLTIYFNNNENQAKEASQIVMNSREKFVKNTLKLKKFQI